MTLSTFLLLSNSIVLGKKVDSLECTSTARTKSVMIWEVQIQKGHVDLVLDIDLERLTTREVSKIS